MTYPIAYATPARRAELRAMGYTEYLRTPEWHQVRWTALAEGLHRCRLCGALDALEVHHACYTTRGAETLADVVVLCDTCHERHHIVRAATVDAAPVHRAPLTDAEARLDLLRCDILRARQDGDHALADTLTREREALWRSQSRGAA